MQMPCNPVYWHLSNVLTKAIELYMIIFDALYGSSILSSPLSTLDITNNTKCFSFKSGRAVRVAKLTKTNWLVVLQLEFWCNTTLY